MKMAFSPIFLNENANFTDQVGENSEGVFTDDMATLVMDQ